jgi:PilZ domain-containing protein
MALRLRYQIDSPRHLRAHVHLVDGAGYFFFPKAVAPKGSLATLEVDFFSSTQAALLRGWVWARSAGGGLWLELAGAQRCLDKLENAPARSDFRLASDQLVLAEPEGMPALLCRLRDISEGGGRLAAMPADAGRANQHIRVALPEAGRGGQQLEAIGRIVWTDQGEVGLQWSAGDVATRAAVQRLVQQAKREWENAEVGVHPRTCRCGGGSALRVVLLG